MLNNIHSESFRLLSPTLITPLPVFGIIDTVLAINCKLQPQIQIFIANRYMISCSAVIVHDEIRFVYFIMMKYALFISS